ncbi:MAG: hypothetical protein Q9192_004601, partial [Flavoplaca navasiana]
RGHGARDETLEFSVRIAIDAERVGIVASTAGISDAHDVAQDIAELEAFFPRVGMHGFGVGAADVHAAADFPCLAPGVGVDGAVIRGAADCAADLRGGEGVAGVGDGLGGAWGEDGGWEAGA